MDKPVVVESASAPKKKEKVDVELRQSTETEETLASGQASSDLGTGSATGHPDMTEARRFNSLSSDDGTETYHSIEYEPIATDNDQEDEHFFDASVVTEEADTVDAEETAAPHDQKRDSREKDAEPIGKADDEYLGDDDDDEVESITQRRESILKELLSQCATRPMAEVWPVLLEPVEEEANVSSTQDNNSDGDYRDVGTFLRNSEFITKNQWYSRDSPSVPPTNAGGGNMGNSEDYGTTAPIALPESNTLTFDAIEMRTDRSIWRQLNPEEEEAITPFGSDSGCGDDVGEIPKNMVLTYVDQDSEETITESPGDGGDDDLSDLRQYNTKEPAGPNTDIMDARDVMRKDRSAWLALQLLHSDEQETSSSYIPDNTYLGYGSGMGTLPKNTAFTDNNQKDSISAKKLFNQHFTMLSPVASSGSTTPESMNDVEVRMSMEFPRKDVTINVEDVDGPGVLPFQGNPASTVGLTRDEGSRDVLAYVTYDQPSYAPVKDTDVMGLNTIHTGKFAENVIENVTSYNAEKRDVKSSFKYHRDSLVKVEDVRGLLAFREKHAENEVPEVTGYEGNDTEMRNAEYSSQCVQPDASRNVKKHVAFRGNYAEDEMKKEDGYEGNDPQKREGDLVLVRVGKVPRMVGYDNLSFIGENAHPVNKCDALKTCPGISGGSSGEYDLETARKFQDLINHSRIEPSDSGSENVAVISMSEIEQEIIPGQESSKVVYGSVEKKFYSAQVDDKEAVDEETRRSCCVKVKKRWITPPVIFFIFMVIFLASCVLVRLTIDGPAHGHGHSPTPTTK